MEARARSLYVLRQMYSSDWLGPMRMDEENSTHYVGRLLDYIRE